MKLKKRFWTKIILMNITCTLVIVSVFTIIRFASSVKQERKNVEDMMRQIAVSNSNQLEGLFDDLDRLTYNMAVASVTREVVKKAAKYEGDNNYFDVYRDDRRRLIQNMQLMAGYNMRDTSIDVISIQGDYVLLDIFDSLSYNRKQMLEMSKMEEFEKQGVKKFFAKSEKDSYKRTDTPMFSYCRKISDEFGDYGYVEIQKAETCLDTIFKSAEDTFDMFSVITCDGEFFYSSDGEKSDWEKTVKTLEEKGIINGNVRIKVDRESYLVYTTCLSTYGIFTYTLLPEAYYTSSIRQEVVILLVQSVCLLLSMIALIMLFSKQLYRPVMELRNKMENFELDDFSHHVITAECTDEIETFERVFAGMMERIHQQNDELIQRKMRELQVSYQALQSQVNPHFLYNTLYLIGLKGGEQGAPEILDMCSYLTRMMAYCVDNREDMVPFSSEIGYMNNYLQLMKYRYLEKLQYEIEIQEEVKNLLVPKFILQPLVENCFTHGFKDCDADEFRIRLSLVIKGEYWNLAIEDNGNGFSKEDEERVAKDVEFVKQSIRNPNAEFVNKTTGIGLINTYARLFISFPDNVQIWIGNGEMKGGLVRISCHARRGADENGSS
ncbi:MAG: histidine kinase [Candidatus Limivivens sp.]|nr:histidine kinase [Candidatus Limivivens sp.]